MCQVKQRRELLRLLRSLHEIGTHRQLVTVFSSAPDDNAALEIKVIRSLPADSSNLLARVPRA